MEGPEVGVFLNVWFRSVFHGAYVCETVPRERERERLGNLNLKH